MDDGVVPPGGAFVIPAWLVGWKGVENDAEVPEAAGLVPSGWELSLADPYWMI